MKPNTQKGNSKSFTSNYSYTLQIVSLIIALVIGLLAPILTDYLPNGIIDGLGAADGKALLYQGYFVSSLLLFFILAYIGIACVPKFWEEIKAYHQKNEMIWRFSENVKNYIDDVQSRTLVIPKISKELVLSNDILNFGLSKFNYEVEINYLEKSNIYKKYDYGVSSSEGVVKFEDLHISKKEGGEWVDIILPESDYNVFYTYCNPSKNGDINPDESKPDKWEYNVSIPISLTSDSTNNRVHLRISETKCPSFKELKNINTNPGYLESIAVMIYYPTDHLSLKIRLDDEELLDFILGRGFVKDKNGLVLDYSVEDRSGHRLDSYCNALFNRRNTPQLSQDERTYEWEVPNPHIGCVYRLYFTLLPRRDLKNRKLIDFKIN